MGDDVADDARWQAVVRLAQAMAAAPDQSALAQATAAAARSTLGALFAQVTRGDPRRGQPRTIAQDGAVAEAGAVAHEGAVAHQGAAVDDDALAHDRATDRDHNRAAGELTGAGEPGGRGPAGAGRGTGHRPGRGTGQGPGRDTGHRPGGEPSGAGGDTVVARIVRHGAVWGELRVGRAPDRPPFTAADAAFAGILAELTATGLAQHERLAEARRLAFTDPLTGLANRRAVDVRLAEALERYRAAGTVVSLLVCDVNGLKAVNDSYGHTVGDQLLERVGTVLASCGSQLPEALVARLGGDEFCLLAVGPPADEVVAVAEEVCRRAAELDLGAGVACGVASTGDPIGPVWSGRRLFRLADAAQYRAKEARAERPVVAGRHGGVADPVVRLAGEPGAGRDRRRFRGRST